MPGSNCDKMIGRMAKLEQHFLEPMSMLTHLVGALASLIGMAILAWLTWHNWPKLITMLIYGGSMTALYTASTLFHGIKIPEAERMWLNRLDHMAIFLLIAGTYTPIVYALFPDPWRWLSLSLVWSVALLGMAYKLFSPKIHGFFNSSIYVFLSWGGAVPLFFAANTLTRLPWRGFTLLLLGGLVYSIGFIVYYWQRPNPWPGVFGHHELWHLFVMGGSLCHYLFILFYVVPV